MANAPIHYDEDADLSVLDDRTVAVIGYGNQGRSQALNMRDSGVDVIVGNRSDDYRSAAEDDGFDAYPIAEAAARGDVVFLLIPDEVAPEVFAEEVAPGMDAGDVLNVAHGYNLTYGFLDPPDDVDVTMVAPRMTGPAVRALYEEGEGFPSIMAVEQDATGEAHAVALAIAKSIGSTRAGVVEGDADMETYTDLLTEQALLPIMINAMIAKFEVETAHGIPPEIVMTELYLSGEFAEVFREMREHGFLGQLPSHSRTSQYGQLSRIGEVDRGPLRSFFEAQLQGLDDGSFVREWSTEQELGRPGLARLYERYRDSEFIRAEQETMARLGIGTETDDEGDGD